MELPYRDTNEELLADAAFYAAIGDANGMERMLLGVLASSGVDKKQHERIEEK